MSLRHETGPSDFLDRMVGKAVGGVDAVALRVSGIYEPLAAGASSEPSDPLPVPDDDENESEQPVPMHPDAAPRRTRSPEEPSALPTRAHALAAAVTDLTPPRTAGRHPEPRERARLDSIEADHSEPTAAARTAAVHRNGQRGERRSRPSATPSDRVDQSPPPEPRRPEDGVTAPVTPRAWEPAPSSRETARRDERTATAVPEGLLVAPTPHGSSIFPDAHPHPAPDRFADRRRDPAGTGIRDTTVNVTIGRVEVRAVQSRAGDKPAARGPSSQPLSLDEYLKQRGGAR